MGTLPVYSSSSSPYPWSQLHLHYPASQEQSPFPRYGPAINPVASEEGDIYMMGGLFDGSLVKRDLWMFKISGQSISCSSVATVFKGPGARVGHAGLLFGNAFIVFGGDTKIDGQEDLDNILYLLNTSSRHWSRVVPSDGVPPGRYGHTLTLLGTKLYLFGGQMESCFFNDLFAYDLNALQNADSNWVSLRIPLIAQTTQDGAIPPARTNHSMVSYNDQLYLFGGTDGITWFNDVWTYKPRFNTWTQLGQVGYIPCPREGHSAALVNDIMYIFGGRTEEGTDLGDLAAFRITSQRWYRFQNMGPAPSPRSGHCMTVFRQQILLLAGEPSSAPRDGRSLSLAHVLDTSKIRYPNDSVATQDKKVGGEASVGLPTDSGYTSMGRPEKNNEQGGVDDDTKTISTDNSELTLLPDVKDNLVSTFASELCQSLRSALNDQQDAVKDVAQTLPELLKDYAIQLRHGALPGLQKDAAVFVRHYRQYVTSTARLFSYAHLVFPSISLYYQTFLRHIARCFQESVASTWREPDDVSRRSSTSDELTMKEKVSFWNTEGSGTPDVPVEMPKDSILLESEVEERENPNIPFLPEARMFLIQSKAYEWLLGRIQTRLILTTRKGTAIDVIRTTIVAGLRSHGLYGKRSPSAHKAVFEVFWSPQMFLREQQYQDGANQAIGEVITVTGSVIDAQALTCAQYIHQTWPSTGDEILQALQATMAQSPSHPHKYQLSNGTELEISLHNSTVLVEATGVEPILAEIGEQLAWLGAACRVSPKDGMAYSTAQITLPESSNLLFRLDFLIDDLPHGEPGPEQNGSCWHSLFRNPVIAKGYPVLARNHREKGLEIPLNMMAQLGEASRATKFDGSLVIKGFSTMFVPTERTGNSVLWHFLYEENQARISYLSARRHCSNYALIDTVDSLCLNSTRNFLGWASSVVMRTGNPDVRYEDIEWTGPNFSSPGCALEKVSISAGKFITGGATFAKGNKVTPIYLSHVGPYLQEIHFARNINVVLYDVRDRRGWLVDGASALLHIVRTQLSSSPYCSSPLFKLENFRHADSKNGADAAQIALTDVRNMEIVIFEDVEIWSELTITGSAKEEETKQKTKKWCFQDLVRQTWHILEQIHDHQTRIWASPGIGLRFTDRDKLEGFGFMDIVSGQNPLRPRVSILKPSGRGWVDFTRSIGAINLLGRGFGELIKPAQHCDNLCSAWKSVPKDKDYLVVCTRNLHEICMKNGDTDSNPLELAQRIYWYKADKLFEPCKCKFNPLQLGHACDRIQVLLPPLSVNSKKHPDPFNNDRGAAIFGRSKRFNWYWPNVGDPAAVTHSEHDSDGKGDLADSGVGTSINTLSLGTSRSGRSANAQILPTSDPPSLENQTWNTSYERIQAREQGEDVNDPIDPDGFEPARRTTRNFILTNKPLPNVPRQLTKAPIHSNKQTVEATQDVTDKPKPTRSHSIRTTPGEPNILTLAGQPIESSRADRQLADNETLATDADNQPRRADRTEAGWKPWRIIKGRMSRVVPRSPGSPKGTQ